MRCVRLLLLPVCTLALILPLGSSVLVASEGHDEAVAALADLEKWLAESDDGEGWKKYLNCEQMHKLLDQGRKAKPEEVQEIIDIYEKNEPGLNRRYFVATREALKNWKAELELPAGDDLTELAKTTGEQAQPVNEARLRFARQQAQQAVRMFGYFLDSGGQAKSEPWKAYLRWNDLQAQLNAQEPDLDTLTQVWALFAADVDGVDHPRFATTREAIRQYLDAARFFENEETGFASVNDALAAYQKEQTAQSAADLGEFLGWLDRTNQAQQLRQAVNYHYTRPNLFMQASEKLVLSGLGDDREDEKEIDRRENGYHITGTEKVKTQVSGKLIPNVRRGEIEMLLNGTNLTDFNQVNGGLTIESTFNTTINANKPVYYTERGLISGEAKADCETKITINKVTANDPDQQEQAEERTEANVPRDEERSTRRANFQATQELNSHTVNAVADANQQMEQDVFMPLIRQGARPRRIKYSSSEDFLFAKVVQATQDELGAPSDPPQAKAKGDLVATMHESWLNNVAKSRFRGSLLSDVSLEKWLEEERGEVPEDLQVTPESDPWNVTYHSNQPLVFEVTPQTLIVTMHGIRFTARDSEMDEPMLIKGVYKVAVKGGKPRLVRQGAVEVSFPEQTGRLSARYIAQKRFWSTKFAALFEEEITELPIDVDSGDEAQELEWSGIQLHDNWATISWKLVPKPAAEDEVAEAK